MSRSIAQKFPLIVAHRGSSALAPENTLAAFEQAIVDEADGIEFDVQLAKDNVPVVFHDATLQRMARKRIRASNLTAAELKTLDIGAWFNLKHPRKADKRFAGETLPTLRETFDFLKDFDGRIYVELKCGKNERTALVEAVAREIRRTALLPNLVLKSFSLEAIRESKRIFPELCTAALFAPKVPSLLKRRRQNRLLRQAQEAKADELSLHCSLATPKMLAAATRENLPVTIWTANRTIWVKRAADLGIRAIITNDPARLLKARRSLFD